MKISQIRKEFFKKNLINPIIFRDAETLLLELDFGPVALIQNWALSSINFCLEDSQLLTDFVWSIWPTRRGKFGLSRLEEGTWHL